jgi:hypothetical protein
VIFCYQARHGTLTTAVVAVEKMTWRMILKEVDHCSCDYCLDCLDAVAVWTTSFVVVAAVVDAGEVVVLSVVIDVVVEVVQDDTCGVASSYAVVVDTLNSRVVEEAYSLVEARA